MPQKTTSTASLETRQLLHVGCGPARADRLPAFFQSSEWRETRLDIDPKVNPDIIGSISDLSAVAEASVDAIWSSHNLEHLNAYEVPIALAEFKRVLKPNGFALISVPDLRAVARHIANDQLTSTLYQSAAGPITALDIVFGHQASQAAGNHFMAHRTGFTCSTLGQCLLNAGFNEVRVHEGRYWDLWAIATMPKASSKLFNQLAGVIQ
jgi:SAM-dependent methyltransferase